MKEICLRATLARVERGLDPRIRTGTVRPKPFELAV
jgi:hypothetical protein